MNESLSAVVDFLSLLGPVRNSAMLQCVVAAAAPVISKTRIRPLCFSCSQFLTIVAASSAPLLYCRYGLVVLPSWSQFNRVVIKPFKMSSVKVLDYDSAE